MSEDLGNNYIINLEFEYFSDLLTSVSKLLMNNPKIISLNETIQV